MSRTRIDFHNELLKVCNHVYYQKPRDSKMEYPCIIYEDAKPNVQYANNKIYIHNKRYSVTYVTKDPDDPVIDQLLYLLPHTEWDRKYIGGNLWHCVYDIYF